MKSTESNAGKQRLMVFRNNDLIIRASKENPPIVAVFCKIRVYTPDIAGKIEEWRVELVT
jgi:RPA family protein